MVTETQWKAELGSRALFPELSALAYLNHAAIAPANAAGLAAVSEAMHDYARHGAGAFPRWEERRARLRVDLARLIAAEPDEIALGWNTSRGVSDVALSVPWKAGDRVLLFRGEFPANVTAWQRAAELFELELVFEEADAFFTDEGLTRLRAALERGVRLVAVSTVQFQTGLRMPIADIGRVCKEYGAELCVDAIQGCGIVPIDVRAEGIDYLCSGGHKWLLGLEGAGFIFVRRECAARLRPYTAGWLSHEDPVRFLFDGPSHLRYDRPLRRSADVFETGTSNLLGLAALGASVPLLLQLGVPSILAHVNEYLDPLEAWLTERGFSSWRAPDVARRSGILAVRPPPEVEVRTLQRALRAEGVITAIPDGNLRFTPHFSNGLAEVPLVIEALERALVKP